MKTNQTIDTILNHRSIRKWKNQVVEEEILQALLEAANRTSTSNGLLQASIIRVTDQSKKDQLAKIAEQDYLATAPELFVFIADNYRNTKVLEEADVTIDYSADGDRFLQGITDASIMAQNVALAAESLGLGIVYFGSILNDTSKTIEVLNLPKRTMPVVGMGIGYGDQEPQLKPRIHLESRVFENEYKVFDNYHEDLKEYDEELQEYYDLRDANRRVDSFTKQLRDKLSLQSELRAKYFQIAKEQDYDI